MSTTPPELEQLAANYRHAVIALENARLALRAGVRNATLSTKELQNITGWSRSQVKAVRLP